MEKSKRRLLAFVSIKLKRERKRKDNSTNNDQKNPENKGKKTPPTHKKHSTSPRY
jgi:hypothetical protein